MSNPSVTATINVDDKASPALKELARLAKMIGEETAKALKGGGDGLTQSLHKANAAATEHLTKLGAMRNMYKEIAAIGAGIAASKVFHAGEAAIGRYIPLEKAVRYNNAILQPTPAEAKMLADQRVRGARVYGTTELDTAHGQEAFIARHFNAATTNAATEVALKVAKAQNISVEQSAKLIEQTTFSRGIDFNDPATATRELTNSANRAAVAAKKGAMTPEDITQFGKYGFGTGTAAGFDQNTMWAIGMDLKRAGVGGDESGVFLRSAASRTLAPTSKAREAYAHMGVNMSDYYTQGDVSPDSVDASLTRRFGKHLSPEAKANLQASIADENQNVMGSRESFVSAVVSAMEKAGEKMSKTDEKRVASAAGNQYDLSKSGLRGGALFNYTLDHASEAELVSIYGEKQAGRMLMLRNGRSKYHEYQDDQAHAEGFNDNIAKERMEGLGAAVDRLSATINASSNEIVKANDGVLTAGANVAAVVAGLPLKMTSGELQGAAVGGTLVAGGLGAATLASLGELALAARGAAAALTGLAATGEGGAIANMSKFSVALGALSKTLGVAGIAIMALPFIAEGLKYADEKAKEYSKTNPNYNPRVGGGKYRSQLAPGRGEFEDLYHVDDGAVSKRNAGFGREWTQRRGATREYLDSLMAGDGAAGGNGWQDSAKVNVVKSDGFKDVEVSGTVSGSAELHNFIEVRPSAYFETLVGQAKSMMTLGLNGRLGTSMQGPGDNGTKPSGGALTGTQ